jgi:hypothetical protein
MSLLSVFLLYFLRYSGIFLLIQDVQEFNDPGLRADPNLPVFKAPGVKLEDVSRLTPFAMNIVPHANF